MAWIERHEHELFIEHVRVNSPLVFGTCRCGEWHGSVRKDAEQVRTDYQAHRAGRTLRPAGEL